MAPEVDDFRRHAACRKVDPELFFPEGTGRAAVAQARLAKTVCRRCIVRMPCLEWALSSGQNEGVWGGLDANERRELRRASAELARGEK
jgi:WhiB family redox-sensing transcriptional regulator